MPTRRALASCLVVAAALAALPLAGCAKPQPVTQFGLNRETPEATFDWFVAAARANQWAAEWSVFSPNARQQANQLAGRNVDLNDYATARQTPIANNSTREMQMLLQSRIAGPAQRVGETVANLTVSGGGRTVTVRMVRLTSWELRVKGEAEPFSGFVRSPGDVVAVATDGSVTVRVTPPGNTASFLRTIPRERIDGFAVKSMWYVDDLSSLQAAVSGMSNQAPASEAPMPGPAPVGPAPAPPPGGFGTLD